MILVRACRRWPAIALLCVALSAHAADREGPTQRPVALPGGTADPAGKTGFVANATGGIDALNLSDGKLLWKTKDASKPLVALDRRLVAWAPVKGKANSLRVLVFETGGKGT